MGRRRNKQRQKINPDQEDDEDLAQGREANSAHSDTPVPVLATQPNGPCMAVAHDTQLWLLNSRAASLTQLDDSATGAPIRAVALDPSGSLILSGGDDKTLRVWQINSRQLLHQWSVPKKISAAIFTADGSYAIFADKFGDVHVAATAESAIGGPRPLLGHFCSIITDLAASPDGKYLVSTDRDSKVRVSMLPKEPLQGAHEIQSYCLGHTSFVTACAFVTTSDCTLLASAGGDGTVRLWDHVSGELLDTCQVPAVRALAAVVEQVEADAQAAAAAKLPEQEAPGTANLDSAPSSTADMEVGDAAANGSGYESDNEDNDEDAPGPRHNAPEPATAAALALAASPDGRYLAVLVEFQDEVTILTVDASGRKLAMSQRLAMHDLALPTAVQFDREGRLWAIGRPRSGSAGALKMGIASLDASGKEFVSAGEEDVPEALRAALAAVVDGGQTVQAGPLGQVNPQLRKRVYTEAETDFRKRNRRDITHKAASAAAAVSSE
ncbi:probable tRNA (guanine-N(7)-)-methyltransferase non-catalytic subunit at N-terminal half [Coccomyxa sp. Obi]|nr:probable tRNA (guanine-N(7)-)-methyltransferase non-catalytic subunit at N-terminal half [Coccomyxa sp. Obi]